MGRTSVRPFSYGGSYVLQSYKKSKCDRCTLFYSVRKVSAKAQNPPVVVAAQNF